MIKKIHVLVISCCVSVVLFVSNYIGTYWICDNLFFGGHEGSCPDVFANGMLIFYPFIPLFFLSIIFYFLHEEIFRAWLKFTYVWIPLTMFLILIAPEYGNAFLPIEKGTVGGFFSLLFIIISLVIIVWQHFALKSKRVV